MTAHAFLVRLPQFTGTLEELFLATHRQELSLADLPLGAVAAQLLRFLQQRPTGGFPDRSMDWAELAARLIRWKSLALLPAGDPACFIAQDELRAEVEEQLRALERAAFQRIRDFLADRLLAAGGALESPSLLGEFRPEQPEEVPLFPSLWSLRQKLQTLRTRARQRRTEATDMLQIAPEELSSEQVFDWIRSRLNTVPPGQWLPAEPLFAELSLPGDRVRVFQGLLELARSSILLEQTCETSFSVASRLSCTS